MAGAAAWLATYDATIELSEARYGISGSKTVTSLAKMSFTERGADTRVVVLCPYEQTFVGLQLKTPSDTAVLRGFMLTEPVGRNKNSTFGFSFESPLPFASMPTGGEAETTTTLYSFNVLFSRTGASQWTLKLSPMSGTSPPPWFYGGEFTLTTSPPEPPWAGLQILFHLRDKDADYSGHISLSNRRSTRP